MEQKKRVLGGAGGGAVWVVCGFFDGWGWMMERFICGILIPIFRKPESIAQLMRKILDSHVPPTSTDAH